MKQHILAGLILSLYMWSPAGFAAPVVQWDLGADLKLDSLSYSNETRARLQALPSVVAKAGKSVRFTFKPELAWDPQNPSSEERLFLNLGEATLKHKTETTSWQVGSNIVTWGVTDGFNPLDVVNVRQYFDPLHSKKLGAVGAMVSHATESFEFDFIVIPENQKPLLPGTESRWLPRQIYIPWSPDAEQILILPENLRYHYSTTEVLNNAFTNNAAARVQGHFGSIDIGVIGYEGAAGFPIVQPEITGTIEQVSPRIVIRADPDVGLRLKHYRQQVAGLSWVSSQFEFLFKYATSYSKSLGTDPLLPGWEHRSVVALEKNLSPTENIGITAVLQTSFINTEKTSESNLSVNEIFRRAVMLGFRATYGENWTATGLLLYDTLHFSHFEELSLARRFADAWTLQASVELISGSPDTALGVYDKNDNVVVSLSRSF